MRAMVRILIITMMMWAVDSDKKKSNLKCVQLSKIDPEAFRGLEDTLQVGL